MEKLAWGAGWKQRGRPTTRPNVPKSQWLRYLTFVRKGLPKTDATWEAFLQLLEAEDSLRSHMLQPDHR